MANRSEWIGGAKMSGDAIGRKDLFVISHLAFFIFQLPLFERLGVQPV
jgi:hypothetical protein